MRILLAHAHLAANGGAEAVARAFGNALHARRIKLGIIDIDGHVTPDGIRHPVPGARFVHRRFGLVNWAVVCRHVRKLARDYDAVLYLFGEGPAVDCPTLVFRHAPVVFARSPDLVTALAGQTGPTFALRKAYGDLCAAIARLGRDDPNAFNVANSQWTADLVTQHTGTVVDSVLYPAANLDPNGTGKAVAGRDIARLVMLGRIVPNKRVDEVLDTASALRAKHPNLSIDIIGRAHRKYAEDLIAQHAQHDWVQFQADVDDTERDQLLGDAAIGVHAYRAEHFGIAVAEMIHAGVLPIVYNNGGVCELVPFEDQRFDDSDDLSAKIEDWMTRPDQSRADRVAALRNSPAFLAACAFEDHLNAVIDDFLNYCSAWTQSGPQEAKATISKRDPLSVREE